MTNTVANIVDYVMADLGESSTHVRQRLLHFAIRGVKQLNYNSLMQYKEVLINMKPNMAIDLPVDCLRYIQVGYLAGNKVILYTEDKNLPTYQGVDDCGTPEALPKDTPNGTLNYLIGYYGDYYAYHYPNGQNVGKYFGQGTSNSNGYFTYDSNTNQLIFQVKTASTTPVYLKYITNGVSADGNTEVPAVAEEALMAWIHWNNAKNTPIKRNEIEYRRQDWTNASRVLKASVNTFTLRDYLLSTRRDFKATPRN